MMISIPKVMYYIENVRGFRMMATLNTETASRSEASYMDGTFPEDGPHVVIKQEHHIVETRLT